MRIAITVNTIWNIYNFRLDLILHLQANGHKVFAIAPFDNYVTKLESIGVTCYDIKLNSKSTNPISDIFLIRNYINIFKEIKPDIILSYTIKPNIYGNFAAGILRIPTLNNISGLGTLFIKKTVLTSFAKLLYKFSLKFSNHVFFQNSFDRSYFINCGIVSNEISSVINGSGVNLNKFKFIKKSNNCDVFLFVGRIIKDKGVIEFLESAIKILKIYPKKKFLLVGEIGVQNKTSISKGVLDLYLSKSSQIRYLGMTDNIIEIMKNADILVLPSYREGLSKTLIESSAIGLPIITTNVPGCKDVVKHLYNGLLCSPKSVTSLFVEMKRMIQFSESQRIQLAINARNVVENKFSSEKIVKQYLIKINEIVKQ